LEGFEGFLVLKGVKGFWFLVSGFERFEGFLVSGFEGFEGFLVSGFEGLVGFEGFLVSRFLVSGFLVSGFEGLRDHAVVFERNEKNH
jgi:hypothetical protein